jgi:protoporphyrinogen oxidase
MGLAHSLTKLGRAVTLFEAAPQLGGLASAWQIGGITWDRHYHVTLFSDSVLRTLLAELGLDVEMRWKKTRTAFYKNGSLYPLSSALDFMFFPLLGPIQKLRLGATILWASRLKDWQSLERIGVEQWLTRLSGRAVFANIWRPLLRSKLGEDYKTTSAAFIWATIQRLYAARSSGLKEEFFGYLPGGYSRMLNVFEAELRKRGTCIHVNAAVGKIGPASLNGGIAVSMKSGESLYFDRVILTLPPPVAAALCPGLSADEIQKLKGVSYLGIICASVLLRRPLSNFYVTNILDGSIPFTGVIEMSALVDGDQLQQYSLVYIPRYLRPDHPDFLKSDAELESEMLGGLKRMYPSLSDSDIHAFRLSRVRHVFPRPTIGYSSRVPSVDSSIPGLNIVNSAHILNGTLNVNQTLTLAQREAQRLHALYR